MIHNLGSANISVVHRTDRLSMSSLLIACIPPNDAPHVFIQATGRQQHASYLIHRVAMQGLSKDL